MRNVAFALAALLAALPLAGGALESNVPTAVPVEDLTSTIDQTPAQQYCCFIWFMGRWYCLPCTP